MPCANADLAIHWVTSAPRTFRYNAVIISFTRIEFAVGTAQRSNINIMTSDRPVPNVQICKLPFFDVNFVKFKNTKLLAAR